MGFLSKIVKTGAVNKAINEAKKPENKAKAKAQAKNLQDKYKGWKANKNNG